MRRVTKDNGNYLEKIKAKHKTMKVVIIKF